MAGAATAMIMRLAKAPRNPAPWCFPTLLARCVGAALPRPFSVGARVSASGSSSSDAGTRFLTPTQDSADGKSSVGASLALPSDGGSVEVLSVGGGGGESGRERAKKNPAVGNGGTRLRKARRDSVDGKSSLEVRVLPVDRESDRDVSNCGVRLRKARQDSADGKSSLAVRVSSVDRESDGEMSNSVGNGSVRLQKVRQDSADGKSSVKVRAFQSDGSSVRISSVNRESSGERPNSVGNGNVRLQKARKDSTDGKSSVEVRVLPVSRESDGGKLISIGNVGVRIRKARQDSTDGKSSVEVRVSSVDRGSDGEKSNSIGIGSVRLRKARQGSTDGKSSATVRVLAVDREIDREKVYSIGMDRMAGGETSVEARGGSSVDNGGMDGGGGSSVGSGGMDRMADGKTSIGGSSVGNGMEEEALQEILNKRRHRSNCLEKVEMLLEHGWTPQQVTRFCATKCYFSVKKLAGMLDLMEKWGIGPTSTLLRYPHLLNYSLKTVESCLLFFKSQGWNQDEIGKIVRACPFVLGKNVETHLKPFLRFIDDQGLIKYTMLKHLLKNSRTFQFTTAPREKIQFLRGLGFESKSTELSRAFVVLGSSRIQRLQEGIDWFRGRGLSEGQVLSMIKANPAILKVSQKKVGTIIDAISGYLQYGLADAARNSVVLQYSFENRILPRCKVLAHLREKGFDTEMLSIRTIFSSTDARFEKLIESITTRSTSIKGKPGTDPKDPPKSKILKG